MEPLERPVSRFFQRYDTFRARLSEHWQRHTNRRSLIILAVCSGVFLYAWITIIQPPSDFPVDRLVSVPQGQSLKEISYTLEEQGVIRSPFFFRLMMSVLGAARTAQAGDYLFKEPKDLFTISRAMAVGAYGLEPIRIRVPEGATVREMARIFSTRLERFDPANFTAQALPHEGFLFPDTYFFLPNANEAIILTTLRQNFDEKVLPLQAEIEASGNSLKDIVTLASIIEREAYNSSDRRMISGVLWNRLERGMPLQVDAVFLYTLGKGTFQLTVDDLTSDDPYNTYKFKGLPPTPIGSPSLDSLMAALYPTNNDYLYFLADRNGVTHFCKTYACQLANKERYF